jgi:hypothetical protein
VSFTSSKFYFFPNQLEKKFVDLEEERLVFEEEELPMPKER